MKKILLAIVGLSIAFNIFAATAFAEVPVIPKPEYLPGPNQTTTASAEETRNYFLNTSIPNIINIAIGLIAIAAFIGLVIGAFNMLTSYGNEEKIKKGKDIIQYSLIGFVFVILSYVIVSLVVSISLPSSSTSFYEFVPDAFALDQKKDLDILFPTEKTIIEDQQSASSTNKVSLPGGDLVSEVIPAALSNVFYLVGLLVFISITVGGILMVTAQGNEEQVKKARTIIIYSLVAMVTLSMGYAIIYGIATLNLENDTSESNDNVFNDTTSE